MFNRLSALFSLVLALNCVTGCGEFLRGGKTASKEKYENRELTLSNYEKIAVGMKEVDVKAIFGEPVETRFSLPGEGELELKLDGRPVDRILSWKDESSSTTKEVVIWVKDGLVLEKGQNGLTVSNKN